MCIFCQTIQVDRHLFDITDDVQVVYDQYPVSKNHVLVIPLQHYQNYFDMPQSIKIICWEAVDKAVHYLSEIDSSITGFNIGINCGQSAGQTVMHTHIHVIPRYDGDMKNPRGGVRHCVQGKGSY